jgi:hypothetical protein
MEKLPGVKAHWTNIQNKHKLLRDLFKARASPESVLIGDLAALNERLSQGINSEFVGVYQKAEVKLGAYGLLPFAICQENAFHAYSEENRNKLPENPEFFGEYQYCPEMVAVVGKCDSVYYYGHDSGHPLGTKPVAVVEAKLFYDRYRSHFHMRDNAILHQIWSSLIGSEAPVGLVLANGRFKFFWKEEHESKTYFFTFPIGHKFGDFARPLDAEVFCEVMFHVIRCSIKIELSPRELLKSDDEPKFPSEQKGKPGLPRRKLAAEKVAKMAKREVDDRGGQDGGSDKKARKVGVFPDGTEFFFAPYDFSYWSESDLEVMDKQLAREKKQLRSTIHFEAERMKAERDDWSNRQTAANTMEFKPEH